MLRRPLVAANWKMNGTAQAVADYAAAWPDTPPDIDIVFCPPWAYLDRLASALRGRGVRFGVQTTAVEPAGAFTGEHAAEMARDLGAEFAIVGHSERRRLHAETDAVVVAKMLAAKRAGLTPIVCVGETLEERRGGNAAGVVLAQLDAIETGAGPSAWEDIVIAYEPVWAIGTGETATPAQAQEMHVVIRDYLAGRSSALGETTRILYGGSVNAANANDLFAQADIDGGLVGGASLVAGEFASICGTAAEPSPR
ncbi:MAG: triose-phosphate isomerase [Gammaproteobacteria bacterium]|nr:triose-phosphate isomerase [Gammaproteobacteria bacterium]MYK47391.1 triose-phosphate isomerase [Gammaproteobacteria bacterium]